MMPNGSSYGGAGGYEFQSQATDFSSPLSHLNESVASLDPLAAMEKSLNHHEQVSSSPIHKLSIFCIKTELVSFHVPGMASWSHFFCPNFCNWSLFFPFFFENCSLCFYVFDL